MDNKESNAIPSDPPMEAPHFVLAAVGIVAVLLLSGLMLIDMITGAAV